jgi:uncharacterized protein (DUF1810 family)
MGFVFPQLRRLGRSATAACVGLAAEREAGTYLEYPVLSARLRECIHQAPGAPKRTAHEGSAKLGSRPWDRRGMDGHDRPLRP